MAKLKVIQWATGTVGRHAMKAVTDLPHLELVGALAYDPAKAGRDAGEHCGAAPSGIAITTDREAIFAMEADCVLYMAQGEGKREQVLDDVCRLLESGKNVVSTAITELIYPKACGDEVVALLLQVISHQIEGVGERLQILRALDHRDLGVEFAT